MRDVTVWQVLDAAAQRWPSRLALTAGDVELTYSELRSLALTLSRRLASVGIGVGDRVIVFAPNLPQWVALEFALARIGAILVPANTSLGRDDLGYVVSHSRARMLIFGGEARGHRLDAVVRALESSPSIRVRLEDGDVPESVAMTDLGDPEFDIAADPIGLDDPINMQYTSGTTGRPKGVLLSARNIVNNADRCASVLGLTERDEVLCQVPLFHCFGCVVVVLASVSRGAGIHLLRTFDAGAALRVVARRRVTTVHGVPTMFQALVDHPGRESMDLGSLRTGIMAGADCPPSLVRRVVNDLGMSELIVGFGLTEASPHVLYTPRTDPLERKLNTVGVPLEGTSVRLVDPQTGLDGDHGEIWVHGEQVMLGYSDDPRATAETITPEGWLRTGDLAERDSEGRYRIVGRSKEMILRGGENVYPAEVEESLRTLPGVAQVAVFGVPDGRLGEQVACAIVPRPGVRLSAESLRAALDGHIARTKIPAFFHFVDELPMTGSGKIKRHLLSRRFTP